MAFFSQLSFIRLISNNQPLQLTFKRSAPNNQSIKFSQSTISKAPSTYITVKMGVNRESRLWQKRSYSPLTPTSPPSSISNHPSQNDNHSAAAQPHAPSQLTLESGFRATGIGKMATKGLRLQIPTSSAEYFRAVSEIGNDRPRQSNPFVADEHDNKTTDVTGSLNEASKPAFKRLRLQIPPIPSQSVEAAPKGLRLQIPSTSLSTLETAPQKLRLQIPTSSATDINQTAPIHKKNNKRVRFQTPSASSGSSSGKRPYPKYPRVFDDTWEDVSDDVFDDVFDKVSDDAIDENSWVSKQKK